MFKKQIALLIALCLLLTSFANVFAFDRAYGDADGDTSITTQDAALVIKHSLGNGPYEGYEYLDVNGNKVIDTDDAAHIIKKSIGVDYLFPVERTTEDITEDSTETTTEVITEESTEATTEEISEETSEETTEETTEATTEIEKVISISEDSVKDVLYVGESIKAETNADTVEKFVWTIGDKVVSGDELEFIAEDNKLVVETAESELPIKAEYNGKYVEVKAILGNDREIVSKIVGPLSILHKITLVDEATSSSAIYVGSVITFDNIFDDDTVVEWYAKDSEDGALAKLENVSGNELFADYDLEGKLIQAIALKNGVKIGESDFVKITVKNINIYTTQGTVPTLYALLNAYQDESESYMWYERTGTADYTKLPKHITPMLPMGAANGAFNTPERMAYVKNIIDANPYAHFNLYCDDLRVQNEIMLFTYNGLSRDRYNVYLLSDGNGTYSYFDQLYANKDTALNNWNYHITAYNTAEKNAQNGFIDKDFYNNNMHGWILPYVDASIHDNVEYWVQWKDALVSGDDEVNSKLNFVSKLPYDMFAQLSPEKQAEFLNAVGINKAEWDEKYFPNNGKKYMIISGGSPSRENGVSGTFEEIIDQVINDFGDDYVYYYKPHPVWPASKVDGREAYLKSKGIIELPAQLPMETLIWAYPNVEIGGYSSTLYSSAVKGSVKFFMADSVNNLDDILINIYNKGLLGEVKFYPQKINVDVVTTGSALDLVTSEGGINVSFNDKNGKAATPISKTESGLNQVTYALIKKKYTLQVDLAEPEKYDVIVDTNTISEDGKVIITINLKK